MLQRYNRAAENEKNISNVIRFFPLFLFPLLLFLILHCRYVFFHQLQKADVYIMYMYFFPLKYK